jgi:uncharacterized protein
MVPAIRDPMPNIAAAIESPCISVCVLHPAAQLCLGCGRTLDEIARWGGMSGTERVRIMAELPARLVALRETIAAQVTPQVTAPVTADKDH